MKTLSRWLIPLFAVLVVTVSLVAADAPWKWTGSVGGGGVEMLIIGDIQVHTRRADPTSAFVLMKETLNRADLVYANLEGLLVTSAGTKIDIPDKPEWTHPGPDGVKALKPANITVVGVANNVASGRDNIMKSLAVLDAHGILHTGAGKNMDEAHRPAIVERKGVKIGFLQYTARWYRDQDMLATATDAGVAKISSRDGLTIDPADLDRLKTDVTRLRPLVDIVVVSHHNRDGSTPVQFGGVRGTAASSDRSKTEDYQRQFAHAALDSGADLVFGHGTHTVQGVEIYNGKPILYAIGHSNFDQPGYEKSKDGLVVRVAIARKRIERVSFVPVTRDANNDVLMLDPSTGEGATLVQAVKDRSTPLPPLKVDGQEVVLFDRAPSTSAGEPAAGWWAHVTFLASDSMNGRDTGSPEQRKAAEYIAAEFKKGGLEPGGTNGYFQPITFRSRRIVEKDSSLKLARTTSRPGIISGTVDTVELGEEATFSMRIEPAESVDADIEFVGYGLQVPEAKFDDLAGLNLKGKIVMLMTGGPSHIPGPLLAHYQNTRWEYLKKAGAIGTFSIQNPKGQDIPWDRSKLSRFMPSVAIADPALDETLGQQVAVTINSAKADKFLAGSGHTIKELLALSNDGKPLPHFPIPSRAKIKVAIETKALESDNVIGILRGTDPRLRDEYVVISAHLDHVGSGEPINGDRIYNGAMDNASGIATLLETAAAAAARHDNKRTLVFAAVTAEEKGLLGSRYFANKPTIPARNIVANLNTDMFLPLFPLKSVVVQGLEESDLANDLKAVARPLAIEVLSDPEPERNAFVRSDQYSFIKTGVPALSLKVGFVKNSAEHEIVRKWRTERYHAPSDDLAQPIDRKAAEDFGKIYLAVVEAVANRPTRPQWNGDSFFRRFAK